MLKNLIILHSSLNPIIGKMGSNYNKTISVLILQGKIQPVISQTTGRPYLTARETSIPCTFDIDQAKSLIGSELKGDIERHEC